jgi:hypothetical protein
VIRLTHRFFHLFSRDADVVPPKVIELLDSMRTEANGLHPGKLPRSLLGTKRREDDD